MLAGVLLLVGAVGPAGAQEAPTDANRVLEGDLIRLKLSQGQRVEAHFLYWSADRMMLGVDGIDGVWPVSVFDMEALEVHTARTRREGLRHYAILGAISGLFLGAGVGLGLHAAGITGQDGGPEAIVTNTLRAAGLGTIGGLITGGVLGGRHPGIGWIGLSLPAR